MRNLKEILKYRDYCIDEFLMSSFNLCRQFPPVLVALSVAAARTGCSTPSPRSWTYLGPNNNRRHRRIVLPSHRLPARSRWTVHPAKTITLTAGCFLTHWLPTTIKTITLTKRVVRMMRPTAATAMATVTASLPPLWGRHLEVARWRLAQRVPVRFPAWFVCLLPPALFPISMVRDPPIFCVSALSARRRCGVMRRLGRSSACRSRQPPQQPPPRRGQQLQKQQRRRQKLQLRRQPQRRRKQQQQQQQRKRQQRQRQRQRLRQQRPRARRHPPQFVCWLAVAWPTVPLCSAHGATTLPATANRQPVAIAWCAVWPPGQKKRPKRPPCYNQHRRLLRPGCQSARWRRLCPL